MSLNDPFAKVPESRALCSADSALRCKWNVTRWQVHMLNAFMLVFIRKIPAHICSLSIATKFRNFQFMTLGRSLRHKAKVLNTFNYLSFGLHPDYSRCCEWNNKLVQLLKWTNAPVNWSRFLLGWQKEGNGGAYGPSWISTYMKSGNQSNHRLAQMRFKKLNSYQKCQAWIEQYTSSINRCSILSCTG